MKLNGWQKLWVVMTLSWIIFVVVFAYKAGEEVNLQMFMESLILPVALYFLGLLVSWMIRGFKSLKEPELDEADILMRDYNEAWAQYKKTNSDEDHHKYLAQKKAYEMNRDLKKKKT